MKKVTFLGPVGATFSHDAYNILAEKYGAPKAVQTNCVPAATNNEILPLICQHGGYGAVAMETLAEGRVAEPVESFIALLKTYSSISECPFRIVGAVRMKIHFCLMARRGVSEAAITKIVSHQKGLGACKNNIANLNVPTEIATSNGKAAELVANDDGCKTTAALGPRSAAEKYGLQILNEEFEDDEALTTFFLIAPVEHTVTQGKENRVLIVFKAMHRPGSLVKALQPFADENLNLIQIHSVHVGNHTYNFALELEVGANQIEAFSRAMKVFEHNIETHLTFGPFEVYSE